MLESTFKTKLIKEIKDRLPGSMVLHLDPPPQGIPDLIVLYNDRWAVLEGKQNGYSSHRPNQDYYVELMDKMSFGRFINPDNKEEVLNDMEYSLQAKRSSRSV